jgi:Phage integrase family
MFPASKTTPPTTVNLTVPQRRSRRYLTEKEIERLMDCARKHGRYGHRDATMILVAYRHGLRASEVCDLQWHQVELAEGRLHVHRRTPSVHPNTRTCCGTPVDTSSPTTDTTRERCNTISATRISSTPCATPRWQPIGSVISGGKRRAALVAKTSPRCHSSPAP